MQTSLHTPGCGQQNSTGTIGRQYSINKPFYAYSSQTKAPRVLQIYAHAQIINVFKHKGQTLESGLGVLLKMGPQVYITPYGILGGKP